LALISLTKIQTQRANISGVNPHYRVTDEVLINETRQRGWILNLFTTHCQIFLGPAVVNYVTLDRITLIQRTKVPCIPWLLESVASVLNVNSISDEFTVLLPRLKENLPLPLQLHLNNLLVGQCTYASFRNFYLHVFWVYENTVMDDNLRKTVRELQSQNHHISQKQQQLQEQNSSKKDEIISHKNKIDVLRRDLAETKMERDDLKLTKSSAQLEMFKLTNVQDSFIEMKDNQIHLLEREKESMLFQIEQMGKHVEALNLNCGEAESVAFEKTQRNKSLESNIQSLRNENDQLRKWVDRIDKEYKSMKEKKDVFRNDFLDAESQRKKMEDTFNSNNDNMFQMKSRLRATEENVVKLSKELHTEQFRRHHAKEKKERLERQMAESNSALAETQDIIFLMRAKMYDLEKVCGQQKEQIKQQSQRLNQMVKREIDVNKKLLIRESALAKKELEISALNQRIFTHKEDIQKVAMDLNSTKSERGLLEVTLEREKRTLTNHVDRKQSRIDELLAEKLVVAEELLGEEVKNEGLRKGLKQALDQTAKMQEEIALMKEERVNIKFENELNLKTIADLRQRLEEHMLKLRGEIETGKLSLEQIEVYYSGILDMERNNTYLEQKLINFQNVFRNIAASTVME